MARFFSQRICSAMLLLFAATGPMVGAEETEPARSWSASAVRLYEAQGTERRLLDRFQRYLNREQWDDAFESAARLLQEDNSTVVAVGDHRLVSTSEYVHQQLAKLPLEVLAEYRGLVDSLAEAWYRQGMAERDQRLLQRVVDEFFCSRWGDEALFALGELALEQGEYQTARRHWSRISRELQSPTNQPVLAYPDTNLNLAGVRARLVLASLYEGDLGRAKQEIKTLSSLHGQAAGRLGGQKVVYTEALAQLLQQAESWQPRSAKSDWPTYAGSPSRTNVSSLARQTTYEEIWSRSLGETMEDQPSVFPVVLGEQLLFQNASQVEALRLDTGERVFVAKGAAFQSSASEENCLGRPCYMLSGSEHGVFGTTLAPLRRQRVSGRARDATSLWGIDLRRDGALSFQQRPKDWNVALVGAPVVVGDRLWGALQAGGLTTRAGIACYDLATRKQVWQRWICRANTPATGRVDELVTNMLAYDSGVVYSCTNLGAIAASRADEGHPLWIATYERKSKSTASAGGHSYYRGPNPCVFYHGTLFVLPTDSQELLALEATTGIVRWRRKMVGPVGQILGVAEGSLLVSDDGFWTFDLRTGEPKIYNEELRLHGQPVITGKTIYWPTEQTIQTVEIATGDFAEETLQLPESGGANLLAAGEYLVAAGPSRLTVYHAQTSRNIPQILQTEKTP